MGSITVNWNNLMPPFSTELYRPYNSERTSLQDVEENIVKQTWLYANGGYSCTTRIKTINFNTIKDHKYYCSYMLNSTFNFFVSVEFCGGVIPTPIETGTNTWIRFSAIGTAVKSGSLPVYFGNLRSGGQITVNQSYILLKSPIYIDLTQMFGVGKQPNINEFEAQCVLNDIDLTQSYSQDLGSEKTWILPNYDFNMALRRMPAHIATVSSGNTIDCQMMAHFKTDIIAPIKSLKINYSPIQLGTGNSSPDNIRPINGWNNIELTRCGINLLQCDTYYNRTASGITYTGTRNSQGEIESVAISGTKTTTNCFTNLNYKDNTLRWPPDGNYATYSYSSQANVIFVNDKEVVTIGDRQPMRDEISRWQVYNLQTKAEYITSSARIQIVPYSSKNAVISSVVKPLICLAQDQGCDFEPYNGQTINITLPTTLYGGTIDLDTGEIVQNYQLFSFDGTENWETVYFGTPNSSSRIMIWLDTISGHNNYDQYRNRPVYCSHFSYGGTGSTTWGEYRYNPTSGTPPRAYFTIVDPNAEHFGTLANFKQFLADQVTNGTPVQALIPLTIPKHQQIDPITLKTLRGINNIWSDAGTVSLQYWTH